MRIQHRIDIAAQPAQVWKLTIDVESLPDTTPTMTEVTMLGPGPLTVGSSVRIKQPAQRAKVWTVIELELNRRFVWTTRSAVVSITAGHDLIETATGTQNTLVVDIEGRFARIFGALLRRPVLKALETENQAFKTAAETEVGDLRSLSAQFRPGLKSQ